VGAAEQNRAEAEAIERVRREAERSREEAVRRGTEHAREILRSRATPIGADADAELAGLVAEAVAEAWDVLDDLAYGDWSQIDQQRARAALERIIEASDAVTPRRASERA
jgi:hypothetical protein